MSRIARVGIVYQRRAEADGPAQGGAVQAEGVEQATRGASPVGQGGVYGRSRARHSSGSARLDHLAAVCGGRARPFVSSLTREKAGAYSAPYREWRDTNVFRSSGRRFLINNGSEQPFRHFLRQARAAAHVVRTACQGLS